MMFVRRTKRLQMTVNSLDHDENKIECWNIACCYCGGCSCLQHGEQVKMSVETKLYLIDENIRTQRVIPAVSHFFNDHDATEAQLLFREALSSQSFEAALDNNRLNAEYLEKQTAELLEGHLPKLMMDDTVGRNTQDAETIRRLQTEKTLNRFLVLYSCTRSIAGSRGITVSRGAFADYLRAKSKWIDEMISLSNEFLWNASDLTPRIGGDAKLLSVNEANDLLNAFRAVPPPEEQELRTQYETMKELLQTAAHDPRYRILIWTI